MFRTLFYIPTFNLTIWLYNLLGHNLGWAIIAVAVLTRVVTIPITRNQIRAAEKNKDFQSKYNAIKKKYKNNKEKQTEELGKLQMQYLPGQLGGCLPLIIQIIFLIQIRSVIVDLVGLNQVADMVEKGEALVQDSKLVEALHDNIFLSDVFSTAVGKLSEVGDLVNEEVVQKITDFVSNMVYGGWIEFPQDFHFNLDFFGLDLSKVATDFSWSDPQIIPYVLIAVAVGASQFFSSKILMGLRAFGEPEAEKEEKSKKKQGKKGEKEDGDSMEDMMKSMNTQMIYIFPVMTILMSLGYLTGGYKLPVGLSIFWTVQSLFVIIQAMIENRGKVVKWVKSRSNSLGLRLGK